MQVTLPVNSNYNCMYICYYITFTIHYTHVVKIRLVMGYNHSSTLNETTKFIVSRKNIQCSKLLTDNKAWMYYSEFIDTNLPQAFLHMGYPWKSIKVNVLFKQLLKWKKVIVKNCKFLEPESFLHNYSIKSLNRFLFSD